MADEKNTKPRMEDKPAVESQDSAVTASDLNTAESVGATLKGDAYVVTSDNGRELVAPLTEDEADDVSKLDLSDVRTRAALLAYRNQIDLDRSDPNKVAQIDALLNRSTA